MSAVQSTPPRVVIADDHGPTRAGLRSILEPAGLEVVAEAGDAEGAIDLTVRHHPDLCLLDVQMPGGGINTASTIATALPEVVIVMLTVSTDEADLFDSLRAGAVGFLPKDMNLNRLPAALFGALDGEAAIPRRLVRNLVDEFRARRPQRLVRAADGEPVELTEREWEIFGQLRDGNATAQIARTLGIRRVTVRTHVSAILRKLRVSSRADALRLLAHR